MLSLPACSDVNSERYCNKSAIDNVIRFRFFVPWQTAVALHRYEYCSRSFSSLLNVVWYTGSVWPAIWSRIFLDLPTASDYILRVAFHCFCYICIQVFLFKISSLICQLAFFLFPFSCCIWKVFIPCQNILPSIFLLLASTSHISEVIVWPYICIRIFWLCCCRNLVGRNLFQLNPHNWPSFKLQLISSLATMTFDIWQRYMIFHFINSFSNAPSPF